MNRECLTPTLPLRGSMVVLRPWTVEDADWYVHARDGQVFRWTGESPDLTVEGTEASIRSHLEQPRWVGLAVADLASGALLGNIALNPADLPPGEGEISYWFSPEGRGRGAATEAVRLLVEWAFASGAFHRIILQTDPENERSQAVARRAGFTLVDADEKRHRFVLEKPAEEQHEALE